MSTKHHRVTPAGQRMGANATRLAKLGADILQEQGLLDVRAPRIRNEMCKTCACTPNSVPNGCLQTQLDFLKAVVDGVPFFCHSPRDGRICAGWLRARAAHVAHPLPPEALAIVDKHQFSPPDQP